LKRAKAPAADLKPFEPIRYTHADWIAEGTRRFGSNMMDWRFVCPVCGNIASCEDFRVFKDRGSEPNSATCECIGRYSGGKRAFDNRKKDDKPCNYAGYGLFQLSPVRVTLPNGKEIHAFAFDEPRPPEGVNPK